MYNNNNFSVGIDENEQVTSHLFKFPLQTKFIVKQQYNSLG